MSKFEFKPKKNIAESGHVFHTNGAAAKRGHAAVIRYMAACKYKTRKFDESTIQDLVTELCHLMDREKIDVNQYIDMALNNWREER